MYIDVTNISISLDSSVNHVSQIAAMELSGVIENGIMLSNNGYPNIVIYNNRIEFGICCNQELIGRSGLLFANFYIEYGNIVYRFGDNIKCSFWTKTIEYKGIFPPSSPDNVVFYKMIYPKFA